MDFFEVEDYREILRLRVKESPKAGRGQLAKLAKYLGVSDTFISMVFKNKKHLNLDQAVHVAEYFGFLPLQTEYFLLLIQIERSTSAALKKIFIQQKRAVLERSTKLSSRLASDMTLTEEQKAQYYSDWFYAAIFLAVEIKGCDSREALENLFKLPRKTINGVIQFLQRADLIREVDHRLVRGSGSIFLPGESPWTRVNQMNWRLRAVENIASGDPLKLYHSSVCTMSLEDFEHVRAKFVSVIEEVRGIVKNSDSEGLFCFNLDWFRVVDPDQS